MPIALEKTKEISIIRPHQNCRKMKKTLMYALLVSVVGVCCAGAMSLGTQKERKPETQVPPGVYEQVFVQDGKVIRDEKDWNPNKPFKQVYLRIE
ncbi:hypothetical protein KBA84_04565 [Patescibacteria group bacterium]|nr:hypothetical protein [Patescibacteria group bacterium]